MILRPCFGIPVFKETESDSDFLHPREPQAKCTVSIVEMYEVKTSGQYDVILVDYVTK